MFKANQYTTTEVYSLDAQNKKFFDLKSITQFRIQQEKQTNKRSFKINK